MSELEDACKATRSYIKGKITTLTTQISKKQPLTISRTAYEQFVKDFEKIRSKLDTNYQEFLSCVDDDDQEEVHTQHQEMDGKLSPIDEFIEKCRIRFETEDEARNEKRRQEKRDEEERLRKEKREDEEKIRREKLEQEERLEEKRIAKGIPYQRTSTMQVQKPKLPQLNLPTFNGRFDEWLPFRDRFNQAVHNRTDLSGAEKFNYLLAALQGRALEAIKSVPVSDDNYEIAYKRITKLFQNNREIAFKLVDNLLDHPPCKVRSSDNLISISNTVSNSLSAIDVIDPDTDVGELIVARLVLRKLDTVTAERFKQNQKTTDIPDLKELMDFIDTEASAIHNPESEAPSRQSEPTKPQQAHSNNNNQPKKEVSRKCLMCSQDHLHFKCPKVTGGTDRERKNAVEKAKLCINCFSPHHVARDCKSKYSCRTCGKKHSTFLHGSFSVPEAPRATAVTTQTLGTSNGNPVLKPTATVAVSNHEGVKISCRALIDNCSDVTFIQESLVRKLGLTTQKLPQKQAIQALQNKPVTTVTHCVDIEMHSLYHPKSQFNVKAYIIKNIGGCFPQKEIQGSRWSHIPTTGLADPEFCNPKPVELLLSTEIHFEVIRSCVLRGKPGEPVAQESELGWLIGGGTTATTENPRCNLTESLDVQLQRFWNVEHGPAEQPRMTREERECEQHFQTTTTRQSDGTYEVELPFKKNAALLGNSKSMALKRFYSLEAKLSRNPTLATQYKEGIDGLIMDGHLELVPTEELNLPDSSTYYLPHHAVVKESSSTTKLRIVFDASAKSSSGVSLNDTLMIGPVIQEDLTSLLTRWRYWKIPLSADIKQMYLYISVHPEHRNFQRIFWRSNANGPIKCYRINKVTFGTASAPFQAVRALRRLADDYDQEHPEAAAVMRRDFYMDDCLTGANTVEEAVRLADQIITLAAKANFTIRKWSSSDATVIASIPEDLRESNGTLEWDTEDTLKALGLIWNPVNDEFKFLVQMHIAATTKRKILSEIAKIFDPLGFLSPVTIRAKMLMQHLWKCNTGWDTRVPDELLQNWKSYQEEIPTIRNIRIPRGIANVEATTHQLHGFCDASEKAYAAAIYFRSLSSSTAHCRLVISKTRVAPLKEQSLPKLELCGAALLAQLMTSVRKSLAHVETEIYAWTDSTITLAWIKSEPQRWKTFVRNRIIMVQENIPSSQWHHVPGIVNPADLPSRGIPATELVNNDLWWNGPEYLKTPTVLPFPGNNQQLELHPSQQELITKEERPVQLTTFLTETESSLNIDQLLKRYSDWNRLRRHVTWWIKLWKFFKKFPQASLSKELTPQELNHAEERICFFLQQSAFGTEIQALESQKPLSKKSSLLSLTPFMKDGLLRVGGRIANADLEYDNRHPILLPKHHVTELIITELHWQLKHSGTNLTLGMLQRRFWIIRARTMVKKIINRCKVCVIYRAKTVEQLMADLPAPRVRMTPPFTHTGVDYAGPIIIKESSRRKASTTKAYIAVFVCLCTKAVTLELVSDLTTSAFIAALSRFTARRRKPTTMKSDNGTTFVGANNELQELFQLLQKQQFETEVVRFLANNGIQWTFIPPSAPHMGGLWEAAVKSAKFHLKRVIGKNILTYEHYDTLLKEVEACLNSRPLCPISSDPNDLTVLTPGHFLLGEPPTALPRPDLTHLPVNRLDRWQHQQQMTQHFWRRWQGEYLQQLQRRTKWKEVHKNVNIGDLVVIRDEQHPPPFWKLGRIEQIHPKANDDLIRIVTVKTATGSFKRPITKLVLLPTHTTEEDKSEETE